MLYWHYRAYFIEIVQMYILAYSTDWSIHRLYAGSALLSTAAHSKSTRLLHLYTYTYRLILKYLYTVDLYLHVYHQYGHLSIHPTHQHTQDTHIPPFVCLAGAEQGSALINCISFKRGTQALHLNKPKLIIDGFNEIIADFLSQLVLFWDSNQPRL